MDTEELLWNAKFEQDTDYEDPYDYRQEWIMERYYEDKELHERFSDLIKNAG